jgi:hypothetical protein
MVTLTVLMISETLLTLQTSRNMAFPQKTNQNAWDWVLTVLLAVLDHFSTQLPRMLLDPIWSNTIEV